MRVRCLVQVEAFDCLLDHREVAVFTRGRERYVCPMSVLSGFLVRDLRIGDYLIATLDVNESGDRLDGLNDWEKAPAPVAEEDL